MNKHDHRAAFNAKRRTEHTPPVDIAELLAEDDRVYCDCPASTSWAELDSERCQACGGLVLGD